MSDKKQCKEGRVCLDSQFEDAACHTGEDAEGRASQDTHITTTGSREMNAALSWLPR